MRMGVVVTDIDDTMMGPGEDLRGICGSVRDLQDLGYVIVPVTAKSVYELARLAPRLCLDAGRSFFIAESGGAIYAGPGLLESPTGSIRVHGYELEYEELGPTLSRLGEELSVVESACGGELVKFSEASPSLIARLTGLPLDASREAAKRVYMEVYWSPQRSCLEKMEALALRRGIYAFLGRRFLHIGGHKGKGFAVRRLLSNPLLRGLKTIGVGDSMADKDFLEITDRAFIIPQRDGGHAGEASHLRLDRPDYSVSIDVAPKGWIMVAEQIKLGIA